MRELALHILDVVENAIMAGAKHIALSVVEDVDADILTITVQDDGRGMDAETMRQVRDPFFTTRTTRHVGLGIPLFAAAAERCAGHLEIESAPGQGATVTAAFQHSHIDRAPLGDMPGTLMGILMRAPERGIEHSQGFDLHYLHRLNKRTFEFDTADIRAELGDLPFSYPDVREWLYEFVTEGEQGIKHDTDR